MVISPLEERETKMIKNINSKIVKIEEFEDMSTKSIFKTVDEYHKVHTPHPEHFDLKYSDIESESEYRVHFENGGTTEWKFDVAHGYRITLENGYTIYAYIAGEVQCCETLGYFMSEDEPDEFIGSTLHSVTVTDDKLKNYEIFEGSFEGNIMFVTLETSAGRLQFVVYNRHNGWYGHHAYMVFIDTTDNNSAIVIHRDHL